MCDTTAVPKKLALAASRLLNTNKLQGMLVLATGTACPWRSWPVGTCRRSLVRLKAVQRGYEANLACSKCSGESIIAGFGKVRMSRLNLRTEERMRSRLRGQHCRRLLRVSRGSWFMVCSTQSDCHYGKSLSETISNAKSRLLDATSKLQACFVSGEDGEETAKLPPCSAGSAGWLGLLGTFQVVWVLSWAMWGAGLIAYRGLEGSKIWGATLQAEHQRLNGPSLAHSQIIPPQPCRLYATGMEAYSFGCQCQVDC